MNRLTSLFDIRYPIVQGGMIWCSGWELASAVSNAGGLGLIGSGSMTPDVLRGQVRKCKANTSHPIGVNIPLLYPDAENKFRILEEEGIRIVFTSAGNPSKWTPWLKDRGFMVAHVVGNVKSAVKCQGAGVDAVVAEGFEAGGHNSREETTTMVLIPMVREAITIPLIAAGGIATGRAMLAALALGADGVQIGSRFVASRESSAHPAFKQKILETIDGDTVLALKKLVPVRLIRNRFTAEVQQMEDQGATHEELAGLLCKGRARKGMFEGDLDEGELEIGQVSGLIHTIPPAGEIIRDIINEFIFAQNELRNRNINS